MEALYCSGCRTICRLTGATKGAQSSELSSSNRSGCRVPSCLLPPGGSLLLVCLLPLHSVHPTQPNWQCISNAHPALSPESGPATDSCYSTISLTPEAALRTMPTPVARRTRSHQPGVDKPAQRSEDPQAAPGPATPDNPEPVLMSDAVCEVVLHAITPPPPPHSVSQHTQACSRASLVTITCCCAVGAATSRSGGCTAHGARDCCGRGSKGATAGDRLLLFQTELLAETLVSERANLPAVFTHHASRHNVNA